MNFFPLFLDWIPYNHNKNNPTVADAADAVKKAQEQLDMILLLTE